jgi:preprotein translocase subunit YajC
MGPAPHVTQVLCSFVVLAAQAAPAAPQPDPNGPLRWMGTLAVVMVLFYFMFIRPQKRKEQDLRSMVHNLKENDRVVTIGGIHGVVTNVKRDAEQVTIRIDESTGAKLRVNMSAIARVLTGDDSETSAAGGNKS